MNKAKEDLWKTSEDIEILSLLIKDGIDINMVINKYNNTKLTQAAETNNLYLVRFLLKQPNINVNIKNINNETALHLTTDILIIYDLVEAGANINALGSENHTPILTHSNDYQIVGYLAKKGADLSIENVYGVTINHIVPDMVKAICTIKKPIELTKMIINDLNEDDLTNALKYLSTKLSNKNKFKAIQVFLKQLDK